VGLWVSVIPYIPIIPNKASGSVLEISGIIEISGI
jgi:hypothetical protein